jgi:hypothetical protein
MRRFSSPILLLSLCIYSNHSGLITIASHTCSFSYYHFPSLQQAIHKKILLVHLHHHHMSRRKLEDDPPLAYSLIRPSTRCGPWRSCLCACFQKVCLFVCFIHSAFQAYKAHARSKCFQKVGFGLKIGRGLLILRSSYWLLLARLI